MAADERPEAADIAAFAARRDEIRSFFPEMTTLLDFEEAWEGHETLSNWKGHGFVSKTMAIRDAFGMSRSRYEGKLLALIDETSPFPAVRRYALEYAPALVKRLAARRDANRAVRTRRVSPP